VKPFSRLNSDTFNPRSGCFTVISLGMNFPHSKKFRQNYHVVLTTFSRHFDFTFVPKAVPLIIAPESVMG
jgi:hypothetical protein